MGRKQKRKQPKRRKPTKDRLTATEKKILGVLSDPANQRTSTVEICRLAGCDRSLYYKAAKKPEFAKALEELKAGQEKGKNEEKPKTENPPEYEPTRKEWALLEQLMNPDNRHKSITEICKLAGCSTDVYYKAYKKPEFVKLQRKIARELFDRALLPVVNATIRQAVRGAHQQQKICLEAAGVYAEKHDVTHHLDGDLAERLLRGRERVIRAKGAGSNAGRGETGG